MNITPRLATAVCCTAIPTLLAAAFVVKQPPANSANENKITTASALTRTDTECAFKHPSLVNAHSVNQVVIPSEQGQHLSFDQHEVTNLQFRQFTTATGYTTLAERGVSIKSTELTTAQQWEPGSAVFVQPDSIAEAATGQWWAFVPGANWKHPNGPGSTIDGLDSHPVVHLAYEDVEAYAAWAGRRLPTAKEWELATRYLESNERRHWHRDHVNAAHAANESDSISKKSPFVANTWQGTFPIRNDADDGHLMTAPVGCYTALASGLHDMIGNVWEWVSVDPIITSNLTAPAKKISTVEQGQTTGLTHSQASTGEIRGGSFLCAPNFCMNYHPSASLQQDLTLGTNHIGFRTVKSLANNDIASR